MHTTSSTTRHHVNHCQSTLVGVSQQSLTEQVQYKLTMSRVCVFLLFRECISHIVLLSLWLMRHLHLQTANPCPTQSGNIPGFPIFNAAAIGNHPDSQHLLTFTCLPTSQHNNTQATIINDIWHVCTSIHTCIHDCIIATYMQTYGHTNIQATLTIQLIHAYGHNNTKHNVDTLHKHTEQPCCKHVPHVGTSRIWTPPKHTHMWHNPKHMIHMQHIEHIHQQCKHMFGRTVCDHATTQMKYTLVILVWCREGDHVCTTTVNCATSSLTCGPHSSLQTQSHTHYNTHMTNTLTTTTQLCHSNTCLICVMRLTHETLALSDKHVCRPCTCSESLFNGSNIWRATLVWAQFDMTHTHQHANCITHRVYQSETTPTQLITNTHTTPTQIITYTRHILTFCSRHHLTDNPIAQL